MIWVIIGIVILIYVILLLLSFTYSCGGWERDCGLCWIGLVQKPLDFVDWVMTKYKKFLNKKNGD